MSLDGDVEMLGIVTNCLVETRDRFVYLPVVRYETD
jgi:hypothetical protein